MTRDERNWWQSAVFYQIYPRSFFDSNHDGEGDLAGIAAKLDYIQSLGVDAIWSCPYFVSPKADNGYDVADYRNIDPAFGTLEDWKTMCDEIHKRGMKFFMDLVISHTSDEHPWFQNAVSSADSPYRDYYFFRRGKEDGSEPSNWLSAFGGSAWKYSEQTGEYYLHIFDPKQPDLNWENPRIMDEAASIIAYWAELGVDGFRLDAFNNTDKDHSFPDVKPLPGQKYGLAFEHYVSRPKVDEYIHELYRRELGPRNLVTVAELAYCPPEKAIGYCAPEREEFDILYFFDMLNFDQEGFDKFRPLPFRLIDLKKTMQHWTDILHGTGALALFLGNHDQCRALSRFGTTGKWRTRSAKTLANAMYFLEGVPFIYQGEELGMTNPDFQSIEEFRDVEALNYWKEHVTENKEDPDKVLRILRERSRDCGRTPMPWDDSPNGGFTDAEPWLRPGSEYRTVNVKAEDANPDSVLQFYRQLIRVRHRCSSVLRGETEWIDLSSGEHMSYFRRTDTELLASLNNFTDHEVPVSLPELPDHKHSEVLLSSCGRTEWNPCNVILSPWECMTVLLTL